jgi:hypothetical protein
MILSSLPQRTHVTERNPPATFMLTFDCEGKWGLSDCLSPRHRRLMTTHALLATYSRLVRLLQRFDIQATFAFTSAFTLSSADFAGLRPDLPAVRGGMDPWLESALAGIDGDRGDGWFAPGCFDVVVEQATHEIASHGFSHMPWRAAYATRKALESELSLTRRVSCFDPSRVTTFVFPRNQVAHTDLLALHGFHGYRGTRPPRYRALRLLEEFDLMPRSEIPQGQHEEPFRVPAGHFLNWRHGLRRLVPLSVTVRRWRNLLDHATRSGGVVHAWTHPENFIDGHGMFALLEEVMELVARQREAGKLRILTSNQYLAHVGSGAPNTDLVRDLDSALAATRRAPAC